MSIELTISEKPDIKTEKVIPSIVFIIPYRNRANDKIKFMNHMKDILQNDNTAMNYEIYFSHQYDKRSFNRGAMKNIGFWQLNKNTQMIIKTLHLFLMTLIQCQQQKILLIIIL